MTYSLARSRPAQSSYYIAVYNFSRKRIFHLQGGVEGVGREDD